MMAEDNIELPQDSLNALMLYVFRAEDLDKCTVESGVRVLRYSRYSDYSRGQSIGASNSR